VRAPAKSATHTHCVNVMDYYLYRDLQRGWRVTAPNLEDCGLLTIDYEGLHGEDGLLRETAVWETGFSIRGDAGGEQFIETPARARLTVAVRAPATSHQTAILTQEGPYRG